MVAHTYMNRIGMHSDLSPMQQMLHIGIHLDICACMNTKLNISAYLVYTNTCEHAQKLVTAYL